MTDAKIYAALPYAIEVVPDVSTDGEACYVARHPELTGCMSHGTTPEEAIANLGEARELYLRSLLEDGVEPPRPATMQATPSNVPFVVIWTSVPSALGNPPTTIITPLPTGRLTPLGEANLILNES